jgi:acetyl-CoA acyltransferase
LIYIGAKMPTKEVWIIDALRTPVGRHGGGLSGVRPDDLAAHVLKALVARAGIPVTDIEDVYLGCVNQSGEDSRNVARMSLLLAGFPETVGGCTVNRLCGSALEAVAIAIRAIMAGESHVYIGGGVESMSRSPWAISKADKGFQIGNQTAYDTTIGWRFVNPQMEAMGHTASMGMTAENLAVIYGISRETQDLFALNSQQKACRAMERGVFTGELIPVKTQKGVIEFDEGPRPETTLEKLNSLKPVFKKGGTVTAGNASTINDGAAALLLVSSEYGQTHGLKPLARIKGTAIAGVPPRIMGIGPVPATEKLLEKIGLQLFDLDLVELNEAFAAQCLAVLSEWKMDYQDPRLNPNGGAIALGHPLGCSGARLLTSLVHEMKKNEEISLGLVSMCIGVGQGISMVVEKI